jgi:hypothetical protein
MQQFYNQLLFSLKLQQALELLLQSDLLDQQVVLGNRQTPLSSKRGSSESIN